MDIQRWDFIEIAHEATAEREYPFRFVDFDATFTHIDSGHSVNISGYYDGDATWRLRFMPTELGTWRYLTSSNTPGLDGHEGRINCVAPSKTYLRGPVATDGHRLAHVDIDRPDGAAAMPGVILPRKAALEVLKLIDDSSGEGGDLVDIALSDGKIRFSFGNIVLTSKLIDGTFPDYQRVIPSGNDKRMEVDCKSFQAAVDRVATISSEKSRAVKMAVNGDTVTLSANNPEQGSGTDEVPVTFNGEGTLEIGFNARYLLDIAGQIEGENISFDLSDGASPTIVRDAADPGALYVLMPMRV